MEGKSGKNDMTEEAAICEAASRPTMQAVRPSFNPSGTRCRLITSCCSQVLTGTNRIHQIRGVLAEFGLVFGISPKVLRAVLCDVIEDASNELSTRARLVVQRAFEHWRELDEHMRWCDQQVGQHVRSSAEAKRAAKVTGIGEIGASALTA